MDSAVQLARQTLGPDAVVLGSRVVEPWGPLRYIVPTHVEVFATIPEPQPIEEETAEDQLTAHLLGMGISARSAAEIVAVASERALDDPSKEGAVDTLGKFLQPRLGSVDGFRSICLVGPTGAGKTTTLAKLAARFALDEGKKVGVITTDTYRIGAVHHLETYADIMGLPSRVVEEPAAIEAAMDDLAHCDVVLVDTSGRNLRRQAARREISSFLEAIDADLVALVVPLTLGLEEMADLAANFDRQEHGALILTKYDESPRRSKVMDSLRIFGMPLVAIANGQTVPDDIWFPTARQLAQSISRGGRVRGA